jgi:hypothetical protein
MFGAVRGLVGKVKREGKGTEKRAGLVDGYGVYECAMMTML